MSTPNPTSVESRLQALEDHVRSWLSSRWIKLAHIAVTVMAFVKAFGLFSGS